jgi:hypothetical protein
MDKKTLSYLKEVIMTDQLNIKPKETQALPTSTNENGSQPPSHATEMPLRELEQSSTPKSPNTELINHASIHKSTGPRTAQGKQRSKFNALKHGLLSKAILREGESRPEYLSLLKGLRDDFQPHGKLEAALVENLAALLWRKRRLFQAERAEISENIASMKHDSVGLIWTIDNPVVLKRCTELLMKLWSELRTRGFNREQDRSLLKTVYGDPDRHHLRQTLQDEYSTWLDTASLAEVVRAVKKSATPEECKQNMMQSIATEVKRLEEYTKNPESIESERANVEILRQSVVDSRGMDCLLRYEAHLSREFDRTLSQLEHLQRMRKGQPVPPTLKLEVSR